MPVTCMVSRLIGNIHYNLANLSTLLGKKMGLGNPIERE